MAPSARVRTVAPTLAPQPPQRMAMAEISLMAAWSAIAGIGAASGCAISGSSLNFAMKRRSMKSLSFQTQAPSKVKPLRAPSAYRSPVEIR